MDHRTVLLTFFCLTFCFFSYSQNRSDLIGSWEIDYEGTLSLMDESSQNRFESLTEEEKSQLKTQLVNQQFFFKEDSTFLIGTKGGTFFDGTWTIENGSLKLDFYSGASKSQHFEMPDPNHLLFIIASPSSDELLNKMYLKKIPSN